MTKLALKTYQALQERLAELHLYEEINEHYAQCNAGAENLRDWVAEISQQAFKLIEECRAALAEELEAGWDIDPPLYHVKQAHDKCVAWLATRTSYCSACEQKVFGPCNSWDCSTPTNIAQPVQPNEADELLTALKLEPNTYRTDGGWLNLPKILAAIKNPEDYPHLEHITDGRDCWCNPEVNYVDPDTGAAVIVHKKPN